MLADRYRGVKTDRDRLAATRKPKTVKAPKVALSGEEKEIALAGGRFSVVGEPWVNRTTLDVAFPQDFDPLNPRRYTDPHAEVRGIIAEVYLDLPPHLRKLLADDDRRPTFKRAVSFHSALCTCPRI